MAESGLREFSVLAGGKALAMPLAVFATVVVGWRLGPSGLGRWTLIAAAGTLLHTALVNWTHASTVRYGREEWVRAGSLNRTLGARLPLLASSLALATLVLVLQPSNWAQRWFAVQPSDRWMVALFAVSVWLAGEAQATLQATGRIMWQAALAPLVGCLSVLGLLLLFWSDQLSLGRAVLAFTLVPIGGWGAAWLYALSRSGTSVGRLVFGDIWRHLRYGAPLMPTLALGYVSDWGDHLLLGHFSSVTEVGVFAMSYQFMVALIAANGVLTILLLPRLVALEVEAPGFARTYVEAEVPTLYALWMIGTVWFVAAVPVGVALLAGPRFDASVNLLLVLLIAIPSSVVTSLYTVLFSLQERMGHVLLYIFLMTLTNIVVSIALIPTRGATGAAVGTLASYAVSQMLYVWDQHRQLAIPALRTWILWITGLVLGVGQFLVGTGAGVRIAWAVVATLVLVGLARTVRCVDRRLIDRLFAGRLTPVAGVINRVLVART